MMFSGVPIEGFALDQILLQGDIDVLDAAEERNLVRADVVGTSGVFFQLHPIIGETPKGWWIRVNGKRRWRSKDSPKNCRTRREALYSLWRRKTLHQRKLEQELERALDAVEVARCVQNLLGRSVKPMTPRFLPNSDFEWLEI